MVDRIEILVEEPSVAEVLYAILPAVLPERWVIGENIFVRPHEGKQDLQHSVPRKLRAARLGNISTGFIILQDQDSSNCRELKHKLLHICDEALGGQTSIHYKVRIVCHELESWYMGDLDALEKTFPRFHAEKYRGKKLFRNPDDCVNPKQELKRLLGDYSQMETARRIALNMDVEKNISHSFHCFLDSIKQMAVDC